MSLQILNAENGENGENFSDDLTAEDCGFCFAPPEPTGRPSILRLSQKENLPPKSVAKAMKVEFCFHIDYVLLPPMIYTTKCVCCLELEDVLVFMFFFSFPLLTPVPFLKVTFQTPLRDPQTRKILSPTMTDKLESTFTLDDCSEAFQDDLLSAPVSIE